MRRLPALAARLRGRAARGRRRRRHRLLPRGDAARPSRPVRRVARRGLDHDAARRRAHPGGPPEVEDADHDRRLRHRRRDPGAAQLRRRQRVRLDRLRVAGVHLDARDLDRGSPTTWRSTSSCAAARSTSASCSRSSPPSCTAAGRTSRLLSVCMECKRRGTTSASRSRTALPASARSRRPAAARSAPRTSAAATAASGRWRRRTRSRSRSACACWG